MMQRFIFWTGMISILAGSSLQFPMFASILMPTEPQGMLLHLFGLMAIFLGIMLIFCSRDLLNRGPLVAWEGILRIGGFLVMAGYGIWGGGGLTLILAGAFDGAVGIFYLIAVPKHLNLSLMALLVDRKAS